MNKAARLFFTAAAFCVGMMLASITVKTLSLDGLLLNLAFYFGGYVFIPSLIWAGCTAMISNKAEPKQAATTPLEPNDQ